MPKQESENSNHYPAPTMDVLCEESNALLKVFFKYAEDEGLSPGEVCIQRAIIPRIILRVDKRKDYFLRYHENTHINEIKQAALMAYWIIKFKPFMVNAGLERLHKYRRINEGFAAYYMLSAFVQCAIETNSLISEPSPQLLKELMYALTYWDLSKESIILIAETFGEGFFRLPAQGLPDKIVDEA